LATVTTNSTLSVPAGATAQFSGSVSGSGVVTKSGDGILKLNSANAITATATVSAGAVELSNANAITNGSVALSIDNGLTFNPGIGTFNVGALSGSSALNLADTASSPVTLSLGGNNSSSTYNGAFTGAGVLAKAGNGTLSLNGTSTYTGGTFIGDN